jgi:hypothetical protein
MLSVLIDHELDYVEQGDRNSQRSPHVGGGEQMGEHAQVCRCVDEFAGLTLSFD